MSRGVFDEHLLADKLSKITRSQKCIETLSYWCIFHQKKAEVVVETWKKQFLNSEKDQREPLLYLANDILQNSRRKGDEFVTEFWKVLPTALKDVLEKGDDQDKQVVSRLVQIWEERNVFVSQGQSLKSVLLRGKEPLLLELNRKRSRSVRIVKKDPHTVQTKLSVGGTAEKIVSAFDAVLNEHSNEDSEIRKCRSAVHRVRKMERDVNVACAVAMDPKRKILGKELAEEENVMKQCIQNLKLVEATRAALVSRLEEALHEQVSELENVRIQIRVAQAQVKEASNMRKRLDNEHSSHRASTTKTATTDANTKPEGAAKSTAITDTNTKPEAAAKSTAITDTNTKPEAAAKSAKAMAAEVADRLAASSSSQSIMTSVLSTLAAEEARKEEAKKGGLTTETMSPKKPTPISGPNVFMPAQQWRPTPNNSYPTPVLAPQSTMQNTFAASQGQYHMPYNNYSSQQFLQSTGGVNAPYGYGSTPPFPPGPPPPHMVPPTHQTPQITQQRPAPIAQHQPAPITQHWPMTQQAPAPPNFQPFQPPGMAAPGMAPPGMAPPGMAPPGMAPPGMAPPGMAPPGMVYYGNPQYPPRNPQ